MQKIIDGVPLAYDEAGSGEALVFLHGFLLDRTIWDEQFAVLAQRCHVIRLDLRGSGESGTADGPALMETLAGDLFGLLDALHVERAIVVGHSLGAYVALAFFRMYAERVAGLGLIAGGVAADSPERRAGRDALIIEVEARGIGAAVAAATPAPAELDPRLAARVAAIAARQSVPGAIAQLIGMKERVGSEDLLEDIAVPVTIIAGDRDASLPAQTLERTAAAIADCEFIRLPGVGQLPMIEAPAATTSALERLVARCAVNSSTDLRTARADRV